MLAHDTFLVCLVVDKLFHIETDANKNQIGKVIYQDHAIIAYHSRRLTK